MVMTEFPIDSAAFAPNFSSRSTDCGDTFPLPPEPPEDQFVDFSSSQAYVDPEFESPLAVSAPMPGPHFFQGPIARAVEKIAPFTEASPTAIYMQVLTMCGIALAGDPYILINSTRQYSNLMTLVVGESSLGAKGTSLDISELLCAPIWIDENIYLRGLSTGEGLIAQLNSEDETFVRRLAIEEEFVGSMRKMQRTGNTLSQTVRAAFDGKPLEISTRADPISVKEYSFGLIGHATPGEYGRNVSSNEIDGGLVNRVLHVFSRRIRLCPEGGNAPPQQLKEAQQIIQGSVIGARGNSTEFKRDDEATKLWREVYVETKVKPSTEKVSAATSRNSFLMAKIQMLLAALDGSMGIIRKEHVLAAHDIVSYSRETLQWLFDSGQISQLLQYQQEILHYLETVGGSATRTEINKDVFKGKKDSAFIGTILNPMIQRGQIRHHHEDTKGRPKEVITLN